VPEFDSTRLAEFRKLRNLMIEPGAVDVLHSNGGKDLWFCDDYVLVNVTDSPAVVGFDQDDGLYRLQANKGLVAREGLPRWNLPIAFAGWRVLTWYPVVATGISITDSEAKAMICFAVVPNPAVTSIQREVGIYDDIGDLRIPLAINEDVWRAFRALWPSAYLMHSGRFDLDGKPRAFRISTSDREERAYIQPAKIPADMRKVVNAAVNAAEIPEGGETGSEKNGDDNKLDEGKCQQQLDDPRR
jgi:hypothetical protein